MSRRIDRVQALLMDDERGRAARAPRIVPVVEGILAARRRVPARRSLLVSVTGIDGSGKGYVAARILEALAARGVRAAGIGVDGWLNLPHVRFDPRDPGGHFYRHAIRFEELLERLVLPLRERRSWRVEADQATETAREYHRQTFEFEDLDVIVLEGIFLLKRALQQHYDLSLWIDCSFETALERAIARGQEGLSPRGTIEAYRTIYFPAQRIHLDRDDPRGSATDILANDPRLPGAQAT